MEFVPLLRLDEPPDGAGVGFGPALPQTGNDWRMLWTAGYSTLSNRNTRPSTFLNSFATRVLFFVLKAVPDWNALPLARTNSPNPNVSSIRSGLAICARTVGSCTALSGRLMRSGSG